MTDFHHATAPCRHAFKRNESTSPSPGARWPHSLIKSCKAGDGPIGRRSTCSDARVGTACLINIRAWSLSYNGHQHEAGLQALLENSQRWAASNLARQHGGGHRPGCSYRADHPVQGTGSARLLHRPEPERLARAAPMPQYGRITKQGCTHAPCWSRQPGQRAVRGPGPLRAFYERIARRHGNHIAVVAVARKLAVVIVQHMLTKDEDYAGVRPALHAKKLRDLELRSGLPARRGQRGAGYEYHLTRTRLAKFLRIAGHANAQTGALGRRFSNSREAASSGARPATRTKSTSRPALTRQRSCC